jgi:hypothetical protein
MKSAAGPGADQALRQRPTMPIQPICRGAFHQVFAYPFFQRAATADTSDRVLDARSPDAARRLNIPGMAARMRRAQCSTKPDQIVGWSRSAGQFSTHVGHSASISASPNPAIGPAQVCRFNNWPGSGLPAFGLAERRFRHRDRGCQSRAFARTRRKALSRTLPLSLSRVRSWISVTSVVRVSSQISHLVQRPDLDLARSRHGIGAALRRLDATIHATIPTRIDRGNPVERQFGLLKAAFERE